MRPRGSILLTWYAAALAPVVCASTAQTSFEDIIVHQVTFGQDHGAALATGDVNGDGVLDLSVGDPQGFGGARAFVLLGPDFSTEIPVVIPHVAEFDFFGSFSGDWGMADLNQDGLDDLYMGTNFSYAGTETSLVGRALVVFAPSFDQSVELSHPLPGTKIQFGRAMAPHDFTGDGILDMAVSAPTAPGPLGEIGSGRIDVYSGTDLAGPSVLAFTPNEPVFGKNWGRVLEVGDWDKDGIDDLLTNSVNDGLLGPSYSWLSGMDPGDIFVWDFDTFEPTITVRTQLVDLDLDGYLDFLGASGAQGGEAVGFSLGPAHVQCTYIYEPEGDNTTDYGHGLDAGDVDRDGWPDLVIGMSQLDIGGEVAVGRVDIHYGPDFATVQSFEGAHQSAQFGVGIHVVDLDGNGFEEIFIGAGIEFGGRVHLYRHSTLRIIGTDQLSVSAGGAIRYSIEVGELSANRLYLLALGASGSVPGVDLAVPAGSVNLPLNPDALTLAAVAKVNTPTFEDFLGVTSELGIGSAKLNVAPIPNPALAGTTVTAAAVVFGPAGEVEYTTDAAEFEMLP